MKKFAFSYLELVIAMSLVVMIVILTAPIMTAMVRKPTPIYGEYKCYVRYLDGEWKLFENSRMNTDSYSAEDTEVTECKFQRPAGNITSYTVTLIGGGGSGSMPLFNASASGAKFSAGESGQNGKQKTFVDTLEKAFNVNNYVSIKICNTANPDYNCIGKGGEPNTNGNSSQENCDKINEIKVRHNKHSLTVSDIYYLLDKGFKIKQSEEQYVKHVLEMASNYNYIRSQCYSSSSSSSGNYWDNYCKYYGSGYYYSYSHWQDEFTYVYRYYLYSDISTFLNNYNCQTSVFSKTKHTGISGENTQIRSTSGNFTIANGGKYGISANYNSELINKSSFTELTKFDAYYYPSSAYIKADNNKYTNCNGDDANNPSNIEVYENFGKGGGGGAIVCKASSNNFSSVTDTYFCSNLDKNSTNSNEVCYTGIGGRGSGGAIIIQWN